MRMNVLSPRILPRAAAGARRGSACLPTLALAFALALMLALAAASAAQAAEPGPVAFNRDIRPILSDNCALCHGPDPGTRKAGLRLDTKEGLYSPTAKRGPAIVPGRLDESALWSRITTRDPDEVMPPPKSHKVLKPEEREIIRRWIQEGAPWQPHWSFIKPERPPTPDAGSLRSRVRNPIDAFVFSRLEGRGLAPAPEADRRVLARRLSLDLVGLPPRAEAVEAFVKDRSPDYYERYVDRLMDSAQWGEHRGRYWLDVARYADTHGLHFDNYREMWPYRDWVIGAFNRNLPFDRFTIEQLAGDLLPHPTTDQIIATGFERCNPTTNEGGTIEEENLANYARDRVETLSWAWLGLTANCAVCHDHKFDPITTRDFYSLSAFFRNTTQTGFDGNVKESSPVLVLVKTDAERARLEALPGEIDVARKAFDKAKKDADADFTRWAETAKADELFRVILTNGLAARLPMNEGRSNELSVVASRGTRWVRLNVPARVNPKGRNNEPSLHFDRGASAALPLLGDVERDEAFSLGGWVWVPGDFDGKAAIVSRMEDRPHGRGWDLEHEHGHYSVHLIHEWPDNAIRLRTKFRVARKGGWQHVMATHDGSGRPEGIHLFVDGKAVEIETDGVRVLRGSIRTRAPMTFAPERPGPHLDGLSIQDFRVYSRSLTPSEVRLLAEEGTVRDWLGKPVAERKPEPRAILLDHYLATQSKPASEALRRLRALERENDGFRFNYPATHVQKEKPNSIGMAHVLFRGQYDKPKDKVSPNVFAALNPFPAQAPTNRLGLAMWLTAPDNPLVARVIVNRFWQELFG
ncbi:MAG: DUF1549 domain-containing protein, partial [Verrucomicrobia bacterium]|nr:DUF1549 domain-containing protein [Verrucomicrobiota bacterium]